MPSELGYAYTKAWRQRNPGAHAAQEKRRWNGPKREELLAKKRAYNKANWATKGKASRDAWRKANWTRLLGVYNSYWRKRRALLVGAEGSFTQDDWLSIVEKQEGRCFDCGEEKKLTVGHLLPLCKGGTNWPSNIVGQCRVCNSRQGQNPHSALEAA